MAKVSGIQNVFSAGELSPLLDARSDLSKYNHGGKTMLNCVAFVQGGYANRGGFHYITRAKYADRAARVVRFEFNVVQAYVLEFGDLYIRFFRNNGSILNATKAITGLLVTNGVFTSAGHGYPDGTEVLIADLVGPTSLNGGRYLIANTLTNTFTLTDLDGNAIDTTSLPAYVSGGTVASVYEIVSPYAEADLFQLKFVQSADVLYILHNRYHTRKLSRTGHTSWTLTEIDFIDGPYLGLNITATTFACSPSSVGTGRTLTASSTVGINGGQGFLATDVGRSFRMRVGTNDWGYGKITGFTSTTVVTVTVESSVGATGATAVWRLGLWSDTTGFAAAATFHENRLCFGGSLELPQRFDGSNTGNYETMSPTDLDGVVPDDRAISFTLNSDGVNAVRWLSSSEKGLLIGTVGAEWVVRASPQNEVLTPSNVKAIHVSSHGSADVDAHRVGQGTLFIQRASTKIREVAYVFEQDGFRAPDMTLLSEHLTLGGLVELIHQEEPQSLLWTPRNDGTLLGVNYVRDQDVVGWHRHIIGGTDGKVESVAVIPSVDESRDELWAVTSRTINGQTVRFIEYMHKLWEHGDAIEDAFFVDAGLTYDGSPVSIVSGLDHLEGEVVTILADGATHPDKTVTSGAITLDRSASVIHVGLGYNSDWGSVKPDLGSQDGTAQTKKKRVRKIAVRLLNSVNVMAGPDEDSLTRVTFRTTDDNMDEAVPLFTGDKFLSMNSTYDDGEVFLRQDQPLPLCVLAVVLYLETIDP